MTSTDQMLADGRRAFARQAWTDAYYRLTSADAESPLAPQDLERLATAAYLTGHDLESTDAFARAHRLLLEHGDAESAVRCAFWLGFGLLLRGDVAQGGGWLSRAHHLVADRDLDCVERGYLLVPAGLMSLGGGDQPVGFEQFESAGRIAGRFGDTDLMALSRLGRGQALLRMDRATEGVAWFDEAMVSVTAGEVTPVVAGIVYCAVIDECRRLFDIRRAQEWTDALSRWCESQPTMVPYGGVPRTACRTWDELAAPYDAARARVLVARASRSIGDHDTSELEFAAARRAFERLGAATALARLETDAGTSGPPAAVAVTAREIEVLRLLATGMTNRGVAGELAISERTVERHLGNIFTKLEVSNRAAATAAAYDLGLVRSRP